jgi:putative lipoprotein
MRFERLGRVLVPVAMLAGCAGAAPRAAMTEARDMEGPAIESEVAWRERLLLPPGATLEVVVEDVARADAAAEVLARVALEDPPPPPIRLRVPLEGVDLAPPRRPNLRARVLLDGRLRFTTDRRYPVPALPAAEPVRLLLVAAEPSPGPPGGRAHEADASLTNTYWKLLAIDGEAIGPEDGAREPHLVLTEADGRLGWRATVGCNRLFGPLEIDGTTIRFPPTAASTRIACPPPFAARERALAGALAAAARWRIAGQRLALLDAGGRVRLEAEAVHLR